MTDHTVGPEGPEGPSGPQGKRGARGAGRGERGLPGPRGEPGDRTKLPRRVFLAFVGLALTNAATFAFAFHDRNERLEQINDGRRLVLTITCAFGSATAEAGRTVLSGQPPTQQGRRRGAAYVRDIARRVKNDTGIEGLVMTNGRNAGSLDCERVRRAANIE